MHTASLRQATLGLLALFAACDAPTRAPQACVDAPCPRQTDAPYVRTTDEATGTQERFWPQAARNCLTIQRADAGEVGVDALDAVIEFAARSWSAAAQPCQAAMCLRVDPPVDRAVELVGDSANLIGVIEEQAVWDRVPEISPTVLAVTITHVDGNTGELLGADIAINAAYHGFSHRDGGPRAGENDLHSVVLHELGHLLGFDHPPDSVDSVMVAGLETGMSRRALTDVDRAGVCETFARPATAANYRRGQAAPKAVPSPED